MSVETQPIQTYKRMLAQERGSHDNLPERQAAEWLWFIDNYKAVRDSFSLWFNVLGYNPEKEGQPRLGTGRRGEETVFITRSSNLLELPGNGDMGSPSLYIELFQEEEVKNPHKTRSRVRNTKRMGKHLPYYTPRELVETRLRKRSAKREKKNESDGKNRQGIIARTPETGLKRALVGYPEENQNDAYERRTDKKVGSTTGYIGTTGVRIYTYSGTPYLDEISTDQLTEVGEFAVEAYDDKQLADLSNSTRQNETVMRSADTSAPHQLESLVLFLEAMSQEALLAETNVYIG